MQSNNSENQAQSRYLATALEYSKAQMESRFVFISQLNLLCLYGLAAALSVFVGLVSWAGTLGASQINNNWPLLITLLGLGIGTTMFAYGFSQKAFTRMEPSIDFVPDTEAISDEIVAEFQKKILSNRHKNITILEEQIFWKNRLVLRAAGIIIFSAIVAGIIALLSSL